MKKFALTAAFAALAASPLAAQDQSATPGADTDGNGTFSLEELKTAYPDLTTETFSTIDSNADGEADLDEVHAAQKAGLLAPAG